MTEPTHEPDELGNPYRSEEGLPEERTELAWTRSGLTLIGSFALLARYVWAGEEGLAAAVTVVLLALGALGWAIGIVHARATAPDSEPASAVKLRSVALGTVALAIAGLVFAIFPAN